MAKKKILFFDFLLKKKQETKLIDRFCVPKALKAGCFIINSKRVLKKFKKKNFYSIFDMTVENSKKKILRVLEIKKKKTFTCAERKTINARHLRFEDYFL